MVLYRTMPYRCYCNLNWVMTTIILIIILLQTLLSFHDFYFFFSSTMRLIPTDVFIRKAQALILLVVCMICFDSTIQKFLESITYTISGSITRVAENHKTNMQQEQQQCLILPSHPSHYLL